MPRKHVPKAPRDRRLNKHLPEAFWPEADTHAFKRIFAPGDRFDDDCPAGAHLSDGSRRHIINGWARLLGFLSRHDVEALALDPIERLTKARLKAFADHLGETVRQTTIASTLDGIYQAARLMAPDQDWGWFKSFIRRIEASSEPINRYPHLTDPARLLELGLKLMDEALLLPPDPWKRRETQVRDGLILMMLAFWPIRRRSLASLTVTRHIERQGATYRLNLFAEDTKEDRPESFVWPAIHAERLKIYLDEIRPRLLGKRNHDAFWVSDQGGELTGDGLYQIVRKRTSAAFGKPMGLHDVRRAAATFIATEHPDLVGIIPGVLQHAGPATAEQHYNLANSTKASKRYGDTLRKLRDHAGIRSSSRPDNSEVTDGQAAKGRSSRQTKETGPVTPISPIIQSPSSFDERDSLGTKAGSRTRLTALADSPDLFDLFGRTTR